MNVAIQALFANYIIAYMPCENRRLYIRMPKNKKSMMFLEFRKNNQIVSY